MKLSNLKSAEAALAFDQKSLAGNSITVRRAPADCPLEGGDSGPKEQGALRLQGLQFKATEEEIAEFFADYNMVPGSIKF